MKSQIIYTVLLAGPLLTAAAPSAQSSLGDGIISIPLTRRDVGTRQAPIASWKRLLPWKRDVTVTTVDNDYLIHKLRIAQAKFSSTAENVAFTAADMQALESDAQTSQDDSDDGVEVSCTFHNSTSGLMADCDFSGTSLAGSQSALADSTSTGSRIHAKANSAFSSADDDDDSDDVSGTNGGDLYAVSIGSRKRSLEPRKRAKAKAQTQTQTSDTKAAAPSTSGGASSQDITTAAYEGIEYYGNVQIGTGTATVMFDTGSADLWIPAAKYAKTSAGVNTGKTASITYGAGSVSGQVWTDAVTLGKAVSSGQGFISATQVSSDFSSTSVAGILGMGYSGLASSGQMTLVQQLIKQGKLTSPVFGFRLNRGSTGSGSELTLGGTNPAYYKGNLNWITLSRQLYWQIPLSGVQVSGKTVMSGLSAIIDTGTTYILAPKAQAQQFYASVPGAQAATEIGAGYYKFPCGQQIAASLIFGGVSYGIQPSDFNLGATSSTSGMCVGAIIGFDISMQAWVVGQSFLKNWYSAYDFGTNRVGFATPA